MAINEDLLHRLSSLNLGSPQPIELQLGDRGVEAYVLAISGHEESLVDLVASSGNWFWDRNCRLVIVSPPGDEGLPYGVYCVPDSTVGELIRFAKTGTYEKVIGLQQDSWAAHGEEQWKKAFSKARAGGAGTVKAVGSHLISHRDTSNGVSGSPKAPEVVHEAFDLISAEYPIEPIVVTEARFSGVFRTKVNTVAIEYICAICMYIAPESVGFVDPDDFSEAAYLQDLNTSGKIHLYFRT